MTREEYDRLFYGHLGLEGTRPSEAELMAAIIELFYENEDLKGRIYELEETLDGRDRRSSVYGPDEHP